MRVFFKTLGTAALILVTLGFILWWGGGPAWYRFTGKSFADLALNAAIWIAGSALYGWIMMKIYAKHPPKAES